jgi:DnaJ-class molecular chaperone
MSSDLYSDLELQRGASADDARKAYLKLSRKYHPDKGGSEDKFKSIQRAYEVLGDEKKKGLYDSMGIIEGENGQNAPQNMGGFGGMPFPFDIGSMFGMFGQGGPGGGMPNGPRVRRAKAPPKVHEVPFRLEDFYKGRSINLQFERQKFCEGCKGQGCLNFVQCGGCNGRGVIEHIMMIGPGMQAVSRAPCAQCAGDGRKPGNQCGSCSGRKFTTEEKTLEVKIHPGMKPGEVLIFENECSDHHDFVERGDVHIVLQEADEPTSLRREGSTLHTNSTLSLSESLIGKTFEIKDHPGYPGGLFIEIPPGFTNGSIFNVDEKGMPLRENRGFGQLSIHIKVVVSDVEKEKLRSQSAILKSLFMSA